MWLTVSGVYMQHINKSEQLITSSSFLMSKVAYLEFSSDPKKPPALGRGETRHTSAFQSGRWTGTQPEDG